MIFNFLCFIEPVTLIILDRRDFVFTSSMDNERMKEGGVDVTKVEPIDTRLGSPKLLFHMKEVDSLLSSCSSSCSSFNTLFFLWKIFPKEVLFQIKASSLSR